MLRHSHHKRRKPYWSLLKPIPASVTYPRPPDFTGTAFLEQLLIMLTPDPAALKEAPDDATFARVTAPLWQYLDVLHPYLWREGKDFPPSPARMDALLKAAHCACR